MVWEYATLPGCKTDKPCCPAGLQGTTRFAGLGWLGRDLGLGTWTLGFLHTYSAHSRCTFFKPPDAFPFHMLQCLIILHHSCCRGSSTAWFEVRLVRRGIQSRLALVTCSSQGPSRHSHSTVTCTKDGIR